MRSWWQQLAFALHGVPSLEQLHGLLERTLDLGILRKPEVRIPAGIEISEWYRAPLVVAIQQDHPLARRPSLSLSQLKAEPFVMYPRRGDCSRRNSMYSVKGRHLQTTDGHQRLLSFVPRAPSRRSEYALARALRNADDGLAATATDKKCDTASKIILGLLLHGAERRSTRCGYRDAASGGQSWPRDSRATSVVRRYVRYQSACDNLRGPAESGVRTLG
jgi:DNA-binding transcriptional LysR family regulator